MYFDRSVRDKIKDIASRYNVTEHTLKRCVLLIEIGCTFKDIQNKIRSNQAFVVSITCYNELFSMVANIERLRDVESFRQVATKEPYYLNESEIGARPKYSVSDLSNDELLILNSL